MSESDAPAAVRAQGSRRFRSSLAVLAEVLAIAVALALTSVKLATVSGGSWRSVFLANGDSLVLPLVMQSLQRHEPFHWVFSSQTFFFPEFPLYAVCSLIAGSVQGALVLNAFLNVILLYVGVRGIAATFAPGQRLRQLVVALAAVLLFLVAMLTEAGVRIVGVGTVEPSRIATVFLMTTYYGGAILVSLGMLALVFWVSGRFDAAAVPRSRVLISGAVATLAGTAITYSDPLFVLWFVAPLGVCLLALLIGRRLTLRLALVLAFPQILGIGLGMLARTVFSQFVAANYDTYIAGTLAPSSAQVLLGVLGDWLSSPAGVLRLLIVVLPIGYAGWFVIVRFRRAKTAELFLAIFILSSTVTLIAGEIVTGQSVTRYLLPLFVFPPLALLLVPFDRVEGRLRAAAPRLRLAVAGGTVAAVIIAVGVSAPATSQLATPRSPVDTACLDRWLDGRALNGIGSFWTVRALALYGHQSGRLLQVTPIDLGVHPWMTNLWTYEGVSFSYALDGGDVTNDALRRRYGAPARIVPCSGYRIFDYSGTAGAAAIDAHIRETLATVTLTHRY